MRSLRQNFLTKGSAGRTCGFTLLEPVLGLLVVILAVVLAFILVGRFRRQAHCAQFGAELQGFARVFGEARAESGRWPATAEEAWAGSPPAGWTQGSPFGGRYGWLPPPQNGLSGQITLTAFSPDQPLDLTSADLLEVDGQIDDGDLATGRLRTGFNGWPVYLVGVRP